MLTAAGAVGSEKRRPVEDRPAVVGTQPMNNNESQGIRPTDCEGSTND